MMPPQVKLFASRAVLGRERGVGKLTLIVFGALTIAVAWTANEVVPIYYRYFELMNQMDSLIRVSGIYTDQELTKKLSTHIKWNQIPAKIEDLVIRRNGDRVRMKLAYDDEWVVTFRDEEHVLYTFHFEADVEGGAGNM